MTNSSKQKNKQSLSLSGEYGVCSELHKRGVLASITYGNSKSADIIIVKADKAFVVEVKTSMKQRIVTSFFQKYTTRDTTPRPDFWVIAHINEQTLLTDFYVLTHEEMASEQMKRNNMSEWEVSDGMKKGVCNILLPQLSEYKNRWDTIINAI